MKKKFVFFSITVVTSLIISCSSSSDDSVDDNNTNVSFERSELLENWADNIIIPAYQEFSSSLSDLETAFSAFNTTTDEVNLIAFRQAWLDAYMVWQRTSLFESGPAESVSYRTNINIFPTDQAAIEQNVLDGNANLDLPSNNDAKGFPALDYLINGSAASDADIVSRFNDTTEGTLLFNYTNAIIQDMITLTDGVLSAWQNGFRDTFVANDGSSPSASVDVLVNDYIFYYEFPLRRGKVGLPSGAFGNTPSETLLEGLFIGGNVANQLCLEALDSAQDFFNGISFSGTTNGVGLDDYLNALDAETLDREPLADIINQQFNEARSSIEALNTFEQELEANPPVNLLETVIALNRVIPLIKTDMLSFLNISVDFQDNDGD